MSTCSLHTHRLTYLHRHIGICVYIHVLIGTHMHIHASTYRKIYEYDITPDISLSINSKQEGVHIYYIKIFTHFLVSILKFRDCRRKIRSQSPISYFLAGNKKIKYKSRSFCAYSGGKIDSEVSALRRLSFFLE